MEEPVTIIGAGGHAKVVIATLRMAGYKVFVALDDDRLKWGSEVLGVRVTGPVSSMKPGARAVIAIGDNAARLRVSRQLTAEWISAVHPSAIVHDREAIGAGSVVLAGAVIQPGASIGAHVIVNTAATVDHDCRVGDFAHLAPGVHLAGGVSVGNGAMLGVGAVTIPGVSIGEWSTVGAGSVVLRDLPPKVIAFGVPATIAQHAHEESDHKNET